MKDDVNKRLCELLGLTWHEWTETKIETDECYSIGNCTCGDKEEQQRPKWQWLSRCYTKNPDFFSPSGRIDLLRRMKERRNYDNFINVIGQTYNMPDCEEFLIEDRFIIDDNGVLARAALEFLEASHEP